MNQAAEVPVNQANVQQEQTDDNERRKKRGPVSIHENMVTNFLKQHSFCADNRRRNSTFTGNGVSLQEIKEHLEEQIPELNPITYGGGGGFLARTIRLSTTTLKRLYLAPPNLVTFCFYLLDTLWQNFSKIDLPGGLLQLFLK